MTKGNLIIGACCTMVATILVAGCSGEAPDDVVDEFRVAMKSDIRGTNPGVERDVVTDDVMLHIVEPLVTVRADLSPAPLLAEKISVSEDGRAYTFRLREGVTFHNGAPLTSAEVKSTWDRILDPDTGWLCSDWYDGSRGLKIETVEIVDALTVRFHLDRPSSLLLDRIANIQCNSGIIHPDSLGPDGAWRSPVGTGPYKLEEWRQGEFVRLRKFAAYRSPPGEADGLAGNRDPQLPTLTWMIIPETSAAKAALLSGQVQLVYGLQANDAGELESSEVVRVYRGESLDWNVLLMQGEHPLLGNRDFRRAIASALDIEAMAKVVTHDISRPNPSVVATASRYHTDCHDEGYTFDADEARALLEKAGYRGEPLTIQTNRRFQNMYDVALLTQNMLREVGINAELKVLEWTTQLDNYYSGAFELMAFGYSGRTDPSLAYEAVLGSREEAAYFQWDDDEAAALLQETARIADPAERERLFCEIHRRMLTDVPFINLFNHYGIDATLKSVEGYENWPAQKPRLWQVSVDRDGG